MLTADGDHVVFVYRNAVALFRLGARASARLLNLPGIARRTVAESTRGVSWVACVLRPGHAELVWSQEGDILCRGSLDGEPLATAPEPYKGCTRLAHSPDGRYLVASGGLFTMLLDAETLRPLAWHMRSSRTRAPILLPHVNVLAMPNHGSYTVRPIVGNKKDDPAIFDRPPTGATSVASSPDGTRYVALFPGPEGEDARIARFGPRADGPVAPAKRADEIAIADDGTLALYCPEGVTLLQPDGRSIAARTPEAPIARVVFAGTLCLAARIDGVVDVLGASDGRAIGRLVCTPEDARIEA